MSGVVSEGPSRSGWLERRTRIALWIAVAESLVVLFSSLTKWTVIGLALVSILGWYVGRESSSRTIRNALWIFATSQLIATIMVIFAWFFTWLAILAVIVAAAVGLMIMLRERR
jgi:hypothetical protein